MKIYLDDIRPTPDGYVQCYTAPQTISLLQHNTGKVTHLSLDHDLGGDDNPLIGTGYDVLLWLEQYPQFAPPDINVHSANPAVQKRMHQAIQSINNK